MKTTCFISLMLLMAWNALDAREYPALPVHPLSVYHSYHIYEFIPTIRILADSISYKERSYVTGDHRGWHAAYKRSADGLTDTINRGYAIDIYRYSPDGKLLLKKNGPPFVTNTVFVYDPQGRLMADTIFSDNQKKTVTTYTYKPDTVWIHAEDFTNPAHYSDEQISYQHTDSGYIEQTIRFRLKGETLQIDTAENEYVFDASNRLIRGGEYRYTHLDDGGYIQYYESRYYKETEQFNHKGYFVKGWTDSYVNMIGEWVTPSFESTAEYHYNPDNPNSNTAVDMLTPQVYGVQDGIIVASEKPAWMHVYTIHGRIVQKIRTMAGKQWMPFTKGVYIVTIGNESYKVAVK